MNKLKILIVEDELVIAEDLKDILEDLGYEVCGIAISAREALAMIDEFAPDLALLDIQIKGGKDGIELAAEINENFHLPFIIVSSYSDRQTLNRAKEVHPLGYLVKPYNEKDILAAIEMAMANYAKEQSKKNEDKSEEFVLKDSLFIRTNGMLVKLKLSDIIYFEADANYTQVYTKDKKFVIRSILKELEAKLDPNRFARVHKSYLINLEEIQGIQAEAVHIAGKEIPISRNQYSWLLHQIKLL
ncbi:response regulator of the LytR/AlgR family [Belliella baltica DSM 15883]|uniref:Response regulator of the LytR/AlgR family n=1 Tax=Belliella baltica (strain DSM 15883 / CIP 108006 / LMG 21964 / BA134) TaxID=866536 RepID=I3Z1M6_BELBD|nr:LytTR family transcriptional regulator DNA-binding domain-containing protein [Belliella baltica]AFL83144.1 response regulator of the LytR/AlgR family [Belliella baltica DSM 15883]